MKEIKQLMAKALELERVQKKYEEAISVYAKLIEIDPNQYIYYFNRGVLYGYLGEIGKAIAEYDRALELNPNHITSRANRSVAYSDRGDLDKAIAESEKCVEMDPDGLASINLRGMHNRRGNKKTQ